jgi:hypothetical protein
MAAMPRSLYRLIHWLMPRLLALACLAAAVDWLVRRFITY